jgi:antitoxin component of RelBE/YafQ-DinJ toxin-antitoxin module
MDSKLTLRIDDDVKEAAKKLAKQRGASVSQMVENYFRLLLESDPNTDVTLSSRGRDDEGSAASEHAESEPKELGPTTRRIAGALQSSTPDTANAPPLHGDTKTDDRRAAAQAAAKKHGSE